MKTYSIKKNEIDKKWLIIDAKGLVLGRLASEVAKLLRGKHKPSFTPHMDCGDNVIIINSKLIKITGGQKLDSKRGKVYYSHTGYPGGLREVKLADLLAKKPNEVITLAVKRMITDNALRQAQIKH